MTEQEKAAAAMTAAGQGFEDMGHGFQVHTFGRYLTPGEVIAWLGGTSTSFVQPTVRS